MQKMVDEFEISQSLWVREAMGHIKKIGIGSTIFVSQKLRKFVPPQFFSVSYSKLAFAASS